MKEFQNESELHCQKKVLDASKGRSVFSWRGPFGPVHQLPLLSIFLVSILTPEDVLQHHPAAARFSSFVRETLLRIFDFADIKHFADSTDYPEVALLVCALHWAWIFIAAFMSALIFEYVRVREGYVIWRARRGGDGRVVWQDLKVVIAGLLLFPSALMVLTMVGGDWSMAPGLTTNNRLGMGLMFWAGFWSAGLMLNATYIFIRAFIDINLRGM